jgi:hypothetical protein
LTGVFNPVFFALGFLATAFELGFMVTILSTRPGVGRYLAGCHGCSHKDSSHSMEPICIASEFICSCKQLKGKQLHSLNELIDRNGEDNEAEVTKQ